MANLSEYRIVHITHAGYHAGETWCGFRGRYNPDEGFAHYGAWVNNPNITICPNCKKVMEES